MPINEPPDGEITGFPAGVDRVQQDALKAEAEAYRAEAGVHELQQERLRRLLAEQDADLESQRVYDFTYTVDYSPVRAAINKLTEWEKINHDPITMRFVTPGGDAHAGFLLYDLLKELRDKDVVINTVAAGICASMGTVLLQAGTNRLIAPHAWLMVHQVQGSLSGSSSEIQVTKVWQDKVADSILDVLAGEDDDRPRTLTKRQIKNRWGTNTAWWIDASEAVEVGFADKIGVLP